MRRFGFPLLVVVLASVLLVLSSCQPVARCYDREFRGGGVIRVCR